MESKSVTLSSLLEGLDCISNDIDKEARVNKIICDSRYVTKGDIFVAIRGENIDGHNFITEAFRKGAQFFVVNKNYDDKLGLKKVVVENTRYALTKMANNFYNYPSRRINVIGITGTNGKTTASYLIESIIAKSGKSSGVIGTINYRMRDKVLDSKNTTPGCLEYQALLNEMINEGLDYCVSEVSSHALAQMRVQGVDFKYAVFTNISSEHMDYHKTMEMYFNTKLELFKNLLSDSYAIINTDDTYAGNIIKSTAARVLTYGLIKKADVSADILDISYSGSRFLAHTPKGKIEIKSRLTATHNIYNSLAAIAFAVAAGIDLNAVKSGIEELAFVPGRLESVDKDQPFKVFIDYAHTDDALLNVLAALKDISRGRIILVFGCGGDRDKMKRPRMGRVASRLADYIILTNDNPRTEGPLNIIDDIKRGIEVNFKDYEIELSRYDAIKRALQIASPSDVVLIAGKGHKDYQIFKDKTIHFSDKDTASELLEEMFSKKIAGHYV